MDAEGHTASGSRPTGWRSRLTPRSIQIALGWIWILDGVLQFQPAMFGRGFVTNVLLPNAHGQPAPLVWSINAFAHFVAPNIAVWNLLFGAVQLLIGVALLFRRTVKPAIVGTAVWAFGIWWFGEGFGMVLTGTASPLTGAPGAVLLYPRPAGKDLTRSGLIGRCRGSTRPVVGARRLGRLLDVVGLALAPSGQPRNGSTTFADFGRGSRRTGLVLPCALHRFCRDRTAYDPPRVGAGTRFVGRRLRSAVYSTTDVLPCDRDGPRVGLLGYRHGAGRCTDR
jgi:hypothetical protein